MSLSRPFRKDIVHKVIKNITKKGINLAKKTLLIKGHAQHFGPAMKTDHGCSDYEQATSRNLVDRIDGSRTQQGTYLLIVPHPKNNIG